MSRKILIIDDELSIRESFVLALEDTGYFTDTAESGKVGCEKVKKTHFDLIFLDLKMPEMNGVETLKNLYRIQNSFTVYIVTAFYNEFFEDLKDLKNKGIPFEILNKPLGNDQIVQVAKGILG